MQVYFPNNLDESIGAQLYHALDLDGYVALLADIDLRVYPQVLLTDYLRYLDEELRAACELFCLGRPVDPEALSDPLREALSRLRPSGIVNTVGHSVCVAPLSLYVLQGMLYFAEMPGPLMSLYYGEDSVALATRLSLLRPLGGKVLDLFSGPGIQGLLAARLGYDVTSVEINPLAADLARCNATLNGCVERYHVNVTSIEDFFHSGNQIEYEKVYANPPLVPIPDEMAYGVIGDGGVDGLKFTRLVAQYACDMLAPGGELVMIGVSGGDESGPYVSDIVDSIVSRTSLHAILSVLSRCPVDAHSAWLELVTRSLDAYALKMGHWDPGRVLSAYRSAGISDVYTYALTLVAPTGAAGVQYGRGVHRYIDLTADEHCGGMRWWLGR